MTTRRLYGSASWQLGAAAPWTQEPSLYAQICVPDAAPAADEGAGQHDAQRVLQGDLRGDLLVAEAVWRRLHAVLIEPSALRLERLYGAITAHRTIDYVDALRDLMLLDPPDPERIHTLARRLCVEAGHPEAVKLAMALLGFLVPCEDQVLLLTLGRDPRLTLYAAVALEATLDVPEPALFALARHATGWGRAMAVLRMESPFEPEVERWLVTSGAKVPAAAQAQVELHILTQTGRVAS